MMAPVASAPTDPSLRDGRDGVVGVVGDASASSRPILLAASSPGDGLLVTLEGPSTDDDNVRQTHALHLRFVSDVSHPHIHRNVRCPSTVSLLSTRLLRGGGSGAAVFSGTDSSLGKIVMKHGGHKDVDELVALATVHRQLTLRGRDLGPAAFRAARDVDGRIPDFRSVYVSPAHLRERGRNLWHLLRRAVQRWGSGGLRARAKSVGGKQEEESSSDSDDTNAASGDGLGGGTTLRRNDSSFSDLKYARPDRRIRIFRGRQQGESDSESEDSLTVVLAERHLNIYLDLPDADVVASSAFDGGTIASVRLSGPPDASGYAALRKLSCDLAAVLRKKIWKATLAQSAIGNPDWPPPTASSLHLSGKLRRDDGALLDVLIDEFVTVVRELRNLTRPEEKDVLSTVKSEIDVLDDRLKRGEEISPADVSPLADAFVGKAILKNFHPANSRFRKLRDAGDRFLWDESMMLTPEESVPAELLGMLLRRDDPVEIGDLFELPDGDDEAMRSKRTGQIAASTSFLDGVYDGSLDDIGWLRLLRHAASLKGKACTDRIWNAGLADAGLHNQFLTEEGKLLLFDLGAPNLEPVPAFLTKFFMSFFHTMGMEESDEEDEGGSWVRRFRVTEREEDDDETKGGEKRKTKTRVALTKETRKLLPQAHLSFERTMDRFVNELFDGEIEVRGLIVKYVVFQLISDAAFCLEKWDVKGGGKDRTDNHNMKLEKWLWRALWDLFAAWHVGSTMLAAEDWTV